MKEKWAILLPVVFVVLGLVLIATWNLSIKTAEAACGASTSSCQTCHEEKGEDSVANKDDWHKQHAFGDFCQACHLGEASQNDKVNAHAGIIAQPLSQPDKSCTSCHPSDAAARVAKYGGNTAGVSSQSGTAAASETAGGTQEQGQESSPWLAWTIGILDVLMLLALLVLVKRWKKGDLK